MHLLKSLVAVLAFLIPFCSYGQEVLHVGMELTYPPFEMIDTQGRPAGISVEMAQALGSFLNKTVIIENIPFVGLIPALKSGKIDAILSSMTMTQERKESIDFSVPYLTIGLALLVPKNSTIKTINDVDITGQVVVVKQGTTGQIYAQNNLKKAQVIVLETESLCVLEIVQEKADAFIYDQLSIYANWQKNLNTTQALLDPFKKEDWAIGVRKGNVALREQINDFIRAYRSSGALDKVEDQYLSQQKAAFKQLGIPLSL